MKRVLWVTPLPLVFDKNITMIEELVGDQIEVAVIAPTSTADIVVAAEGSDVVVMGSTPGHIELGAVAALAVRVFQPIMETYRNNRNEPERRLVGYGEVVK